MSMPPIKFLFMCSFIRLTVGAISGGRRPPAGLPGYTSALGFQALMRLVREAGLPPFSGIRHAPVPGGLPDPCSSAIQILNALHWHPASVINLRGCASLYGEDRYHGQAGYPELTTQWLRLPTDLIAALPSTARIHRHLGFEMSHPSTPA